MTSQRPGACRPLTVSSLARTPQDLEAQWDSFAEAELGGTLETEASLLRLACRSPDSAHIWPVIPGPGPDAHGNGPRPGSGSNVRSFLRLLLTIAAGTSEGMGLDTAHALRAEAAAAPDAAATTTTTTTTGAFISDQELAGQSLHFEQFLSQVVLQLAHLGGSGTAGDGAQSPSDPAGGSASPPAGAANGGGPPLMMDLLSRRRLRLAFFLRSGQCPLDLTPQHLTAGRPFPWQPAAFDAGDLWDAFYPIAGRLATVHAPGPEDALWQRLLALHPLLGPGVPGPSPGQDPASAASSPGPLPTHASICFRWELALLAIQSQQLLVASRILLASATSVPLSASRRRDCLALLRFLALARGPAPGSGTAAPDVATSAAAASASSSALQLPLAVAVPHSGAGDTSQLVTISSCWILAVVNALAPQMDSKPGSTELLRDLFLHSSLSGTSLCPSTAGIIIGVLSHYSIQFMGPGEPEPNSDDPDHVAKAGLSLAFTNYLQRCLAELSSSARSARLTRNLSRAHLQNLSLRHKAERATRGVVIHEESTCCLCGKQLIQEPSGLSAAAAASHDAHSGGFVMIPLFSTASDYDLAGDLSPRDGQAMAVYLAQGMSASFARPPPAGVERLPPEPTGVGTAHVQCANLAGLF
ncbi:hypothetical protein H696_06233 [Fonticula alba]|uniref:Uncharacterized protein n=1 Tax=Fonticula alba TaxID=691883 RepID=A0A058YZC4_FONAL|nr:hypothetical protein H696_06233 [Fonticula alba]KCV67334.1 hypothetical protein H696_06233 [Fonticula alba]|eukprot:XP_009498256.1 hypothetical protein H696_06233 [Fonticula alba]